MYSIGIFSNISELTTFPFSNIKVFAEREFTHKDNYRFSLYTKEQKEVFLANVQTGSFDGIIFATNTANDITLKEFFENNVDVFSKYLSMGGGILVLLQYHLAIANSAFQILSDTDFPGLASTKIITKQNNDENNSPIAFAREKLICQSDNIIFKYPKDILSNDGLFFTAMEKNQWQTSATPLFAYIDCFPESDFYSLIDYNESNEVERKKSFCIVSRNTTKRVVYTTLGLDLEENSLLENLVSYISKGEPSIYFKSCGACARRGETCDFIDLLNNTKIHFSGDENIKHLVKYEIGNCATTTKLSASNEGNKPEERNAIPIKQLIPINDCGRISRSVNVSAVKYMCKLGAQFLRTQLKGGKYGSLIGTQSTLQFFHLLNIDISEDDKKAILEYLKSHNKDHATFDAIKEPTILAHNILDLLGYADSDINFTFTESDRKQAPYNVEFLSMQPISNVVKLLGRTLVPIDELIIDNEQQVKEYLLTAFAQIISSKDTGKISWESDCFMTSLMLIVLLKIEQWLLSYDQRNKTNCVSKINIIATYFEESSELSLCSALVESADAERAKAHSFSQQLIAEKKTVLELKDEIKISQSEKRDFVSLENRVRMFQTISIILFFFVVAIVVFFITVLLRAQYSKENIYEFITSLSPLEIIFSIAGVIVVPFTIGTIYWKKDKIHDNAVKKDRKSKKSFLKRLFHGKKSK